MVGLRLHVGDEQQARVLRVVALKGTTVEYSLVGYQSLLSFFLLHGAIVFTWLCVAVAAKLRGYLLHTTSVVTDGILFIFYH